MNQALSIEIFASKLEKGGFLGFLQKQPPKEEVSEYMASGVEARTWSLARYITENYIKSKDGMDSDIKKFLAK